MATGISIGHDSTSSRLIEEALRRGGHEHAAISHIDAALEALPALKPEMIIVDLCVPCASQLAVIRHVSVVAPLSRVIVTTGRPLPLDVLPAIVMRHVGYLPKPLSPSEIDAAIDLALQQAPRHAELAGRLLVRLARPGITIPDVIRLAECVKVIGVTDQPATIAMVERVERLLMHDVTRAPAAGDGPVHAVVRHFEGASPSGRIGNLTRLGIDLARSPSHLKRLLRSETGIGVSQWRAAARLRATVRAIVETGRPVRELIRVLGWSSASDLDHFLKKQLGASPRTIRCLAQNAQRDAASEQCKTTTMAQVRGCSQA